MSEVALYFHGLVKIIVVGGMILLSCRAAGNTGQDTVPTKVYGGSGMKMSLAKTAQPVNQIA